MVKVFAVTFTVTLLLGISLLIAYGPGRQQPFATVTTWQGEGLPGPELLALSASEPAPFVAAEDDCPPIHPDHMNDPPLPPVEGQVWSPARGWIAETEANRTGEFVYTQPPYYSEQQLRAAAMARYGRSWQLRPQSDQRLSGAD